MQASGSKQQGRVVSSQNRINMVIEAIRNTSVFASIIFTMVVVEWLEWLGYDAESRRKA